MWTFSRQFFLFSILINLCQVDSIAQENESVKNDGKWILFVKERPLISSDSVRIKNEQHDTINQISADGKKQGHWIYYGKDKPDSGYPLEGKIEEGNYLNDRKEGVWQKYYEDGTTIKLRGTYVNNRPDGPFAKYYRNGNLKEKGCFTAKRHSCDHSYYYETGVLMEKTVVSVLVDTTFKYFPNGCLESIETKFYISNGRPMLVNYRNEPCNEVIDTLFYILPGAGIANISDCYEDERIEFIYSLSDSSFRFLPKNKELYSDIEICKGNHLGKNDKNSEILFNGECKNGIAWNGKFYFYDSDGILLRIERWKSGCYVGLGEL